MESASSRMVAAVKKLRLKDDFIAYSTSINAQFVQGFWFQNRVKNYKYIIIKKGI